MATSETLPLGTPCWIDLGSSQPEKATDFYASMFGWVAEQAGEEYGNYITFTKDGVGAMAFVTDAGGAAIGIRQPGGHPGFAAHGRPATAVCHELHTRDYTAVVKFYQDVFGWETQVASDEEDFRYTLQVVEGQQ